VRAKEVMKPRLVYGLTPPANAFGDGSSITYTNGFGSPALPDV
jgi:hypothetical protein